MTLNQNLPLFPKGMLPVTVLLKILHLKVKMCRSIVVNKIRTRRCPEPGFSQQPRCIPVPCNYPLQASGCVISERNRLRKWRMRSSSFHINDKRLFFDSATYQVSEHRYCLHYTLQEFSFRKTIQEHKICSDMLNSFERYSFHKYIVRNRSNSKFYKN